MHWIKEELTGNYKTKRRGCEGCVEFDESNSKWRWKASVGTLRASGTQNDLDAAKKRVEIFLEGA